MSFTVDLRLVQKTLDRMEQALRKRILHAANTLAHNPRQPGSRKLEGTTDIDLRISHSCDTLRIDPWQSRADRRESSPNRCRTHRIGARIQAAMTGKMDSDNIIPLTPRQNTGG
ncbi:MAG: hypothetical protein HQM04_08015 [Magnetococcales bacterium]|nr:hypothetical protein [Magnetococcales bacterium]MBF0114976.1 hypothetical protein [Magnetococcales bacterium]